MSYREGTEIIIENIGNSNIINYLNDNFSHKLDIKFISHPRKLLFADVNDDILFFLFNYFKPKFGNLIMPDYFRYPDRKSAIGAHISLAYPDELCDKDVFNFPEHIKVNYRKVLKVVLDRNYYVVEVESPDIDKVRNIIGLGSKLNYKEFDIFPHITFGVEESTNV